MNEKSIKILGLEMDIKIYDLNRASKRECSKKKMRQVY
jgi:hypothetical protein